MTGHKYKVKEQLHTFGICELLLHSQEARDRVACGRARGQTLFVQSILIMIYNYFFFNINPNSKTLGCEM